MENDPELYRVADGYCSKTDKTIFYESKNQAIHNAIFNLKLEYESMIQTRKAKNLKWKFQIILSKCLIVSFMIRWIFMIR